MNHLYSKPTHLLTGLLGCAALAMAAIELEKFSWFSAHGFSALTMAMLLGMLIGNTIYRSFGEYAGSGVAFSKQHFLRAGVVLYGLRLTLQDIGHVGVAGVMIDASVLVSTFAWAWFIGTKLLKLDHQTAMLVGAGSAICGAAAVMATEPVLKARAEKVTVAISTVVVFGTLAIFVYPAIYQLNRVFGFMPSGSNAFGVYAGSTIHEVAQVVAAANSVSAAAADTAVIAKMVRVMMLAPFLILLSGWMACGARQEVDDALPHDKKTLAIPWFAFLFIGVVFFNSLNLLTASTRLLCNQVDTFLLAMAMGALGLTTHFSAIRHAGVKPLLLAAILFVWLVVGGAVMNVGISRLWGLF